MQVQGCVIGCLESGKVCGLEREGIVEFVNSLGSFREDIWPYCATGFLALRVLGDSTQEEEGLYGL